MLERDEAIVRRFRELAETQGSRGARATYRVSGGAPGERYDQRIDLSPGERVSVDVRDELNQQTIRHAEVELPGQTTSGLLQTLADALGTMVSREEASFLPDSTVGSVTIEVDGGSTTLYFAADDEDLRQYALLDDRYLSDAVRRMQEFAADVLERG